VTIQLHSGANFNCWTKPLSRRKTSRLLRSHFQHNSF